MKSSLQKVMPVVDVNGSDSAMLDNTLEFLVMNGVELPLAVMMCIPEPWEKNDTISQTIDELRTIIAKMAARHCIESMPIIHSLKGIIERMKILLKNSY